MMVASQARKRFVSSKLQLFQLPEYEREKFLDLFPLGGIFPEISVYLCIF
jgi:hypothetical protein